MTDIQLSARQQEVLRHIRSDPAQSLQEIGDAIGITRERVRQISAKLTAEGVIEDRRVLKEKARDAIKTAEQETRERRKTMWRRMLFISHRQVYRHMARIDQFGLTREYHMPGQETVCQYEGCSRPVDARGFCGNHYGRLRYTGSLWVRRRSRLLCKEKGCYWPTYARDLCHNHYNAYMRKNPAVSVLPNHNTSGYRGVCWHNTEQRWAANIRKPGIGQEYLGSFESKEMAARAYDTAARKYLGERAKLNFPDEHIEVVKEKRVRSSPVASSGYRGVSWYTRRKRWAVSITRDGKRIFVGRFIDLEAAARAYDSAAAHYFGEAAILNYPNDIPAPYVPASKKRAKASSSYIGVYWDKTCNRWIARVRTTEKYLNAGRYESDQDAARAYDAVARAQLGELAVLNFPDEDIQIEDVRVIRQRGGQRGEYHPGGVHRRAGGSSQYRGVTRKNDRWCARIEVKGKNIRLGSFGSEEEAARAYDKAATEYFKDNARLNFGALYDQDINSYE